MNSLFEFFILPENLIFAIALTIVFLIGVLEGVGLILGMSVVGLMDTLLPEGALEFEIDGPDMESSSSLGRLIGWIRYEKVPIIITLIAFLTSFGLFGMIMQAMMLNVVGFLLPLIIATVISGVISLPGTRLFNKLLSMVIPTDESSAITLDSLVGRLATISMGEAKKNSPAQGKVKDQNGKTHYIMIEPDDSDIILKRGEQVILVRKEKSRFFGIKNTNQTLNEL